MLAIDSPVRIDKPTATPIGPSASVVAKTRTRAPRDKDPSTRRYTATTAPMHAIAAVNTAFPTIGHGPLAGLGIAIARPTIVASNGFKRIDAAPTTIAERFYRPLSSRTSPKLNAAIAKMRKVTNTT